MKDTPSLASPIALGTVMIFVLFPSPSAVIYTVQAFLHVALTGD
jgi:hypothetical protein